MKTASYLRIFVALMAMTAAACSDPIEEATTTTTILPPTGGGTNVQTIHGEYYTSVTTWTYGEDGNYVGLVTQTLGYLEDVDVIVVRNGTRIPVDGELDATRVVTSHAAHGEYYWASYRNNVLLLNYIGLTPASTPPYPLEVIIVYDHITIVY